MDFYNLLAAYPAYSSLSLEKKIGSASIPLFFIFWISHFVMKYRPLKGYVRPGNLIKAFNCFPVYLTSPLFTRSVLDDCIIYI